MQGRKANWFVYIFCGNCLLEHVTEEKIERTKYKEEDISIY
jgi:hypothetical protein